MAPSVDYDDIAATYDERYEFNQYPELESAIVDFVVQVRPGGHARALEVGCGTGYWPSSVERATSAVQLFGVDLSMEMLRRAKTNACRAMVVCADAGRLPWTDTSFDRVFCVNAFHHFANGQLFLAEARRVLVPGGAVIDYRTRSAPGRRRLVRLRLLCRHARKRSTSVSRHHGDTRVDARHRPFRLLDQRSAANHGRYSGRRGVTDRTTEEVIDVTACVAIR
jgi:ubiquinone/menaquinone biosynthesis C-methylase UbiE